MVLNAILSRLVLAAFLLCFAASAGLARGETGADVDRREPELAASASALADQIDALLTARFAALNGVAAPDVRRQGLLDLSEFATVTVEGLIEASPTRPMRVHIEADLRPVLARHQRTIASALVALRERTASVAEAPSVANVP